MKKVRNFQTFNIQCDAKYSQYKGRGGWRKKGSKRVKVGLKPRGANVKPCSSVLSVHSMWWYH